MRLSDLLEKLVVDEDGQRLGVVHDVVALQDGPIMGGFGAALRLEALVIGPHGVFVRLGLSAAHVHGPRLVRRVSRLRGDTDEIPWSDVVEVATDRIVVTRR